MKKIFFLFALLACMSMAVAQRVSAPGGLMSINEEGTCYEVTLSCIDQDKAVDLLVDHCIKARTAAQQIGIYIVDYNPVYYADFADKATYAIFLDERVKNQEGYPMYFTSIAKVREQLKGCIKYDLENDIDHEYTPDVSYLEGH
jgi:hypothetical protein